MVYIVVVSVMKRSCAYLAMVLSHITLKESGVQRILMSERA